MVKTCDNCGNSFEAQRETAKYCSTKCKLAYHRNEISVTKDQVSVSSQANDDTVNVTLKTDPVRERLIELFREEGKTETEISSIMKNQDHYYLTRGYYFIPARFTRLMQ